MNTSALSDRWIEADVHAFDRNADITEEAERFVARFAPVLRGAEGVAGIILNVGWLADFITMFSGDLASDVPYPRRMEFQQFFDDRRADGHHADNRERWHRRFETARSNAIAAAEPWTYLQLKDLVRALRDSLARNGASDPRVGCFVLGWASAYDGAWEEFATRHPEAYLTMGPGVFNTPALLAADGRAYAAYPDGIPEGTPFTEFFAAQWGLLSRAVDLDTIVLRDSTIGPGVYERVGPFGTAAASDPEAYRQWLDATADLVRLTKLANTSALVGGYSTAASAVGELRVNATDLERIAHEGYLDFWIDQTWAGAWNEVGVREEAFWNGPHRGYTYQLAFVLLHAAMLAKTSVKHYVLIETWDVWESWDVIHTVPQRLLWQIWAYTHAAVKQPDGLRLPAGIYISWANQGTELLASADVSFLAGNIQAAIDDARQVTDVHGPTLVYNRRAMAQLNEVTPDLSVNEWIDETAGTLLKWSVPVLSVARIEDLPEIESDLLVIQTPTGLDAIDKQNVLAAIASDQPVAIVGSIGLGIEPDVARAIGIKASGATSTDPQLQLGTITEDCRAESRGLPLSFALFQRQVGATQLADHLRTSYSIDGSPVLITADDGSPTPRTVVWDPPELRGMQWAPGDRPLIDRLVSPSPWVIAARVLTGIQRDAVLVADSLDVDQPLNVLGWATTRGERILIADLEEGLVDESDARTGRTVIRHKGATGATSWQTTLGDPRISDAAQGFQVSIDRGDAALLATKPVQDE